MVPILFYYSVTLGSVVLAYSLAIAAVIGVLLLPFRNALQALYDAEGRRQAMLVESLHGISTIKSLALDAEQRQLWETLSAGVVERTFTVGKIRTWARTITHLLEQLMIVTVIGLGVLLVFDRSLTVGELIAFQMLSVRVITPFVQVVHLIHQYQEADIAVRMLGRIMNAPAERSSKARELRPPVRGRIEFDRVSFTYDDADRPACDDISLEIEAQTTVGIVGPSGSGKTTLARLIQALYPAQKGSLRLDGVDLNQIDLDHLRRHIGIVPQESFLFRGTVRENISKSKPDATFEEVAEAARVAGAYEFITRDLPHQFNEMLEEGAVNLSGGQRQRLAIARAVLRDPPVLILDEATSALDPDSEYAVQQRLSQIGHGRTLLIISHRVSMICRADRIVVIKGGRIVDIGSHSELLKSNRDDFYRMMWDRQTNPAA
jgi:ATP-binding cassette subfamily B protein